MNKTIEDYIRETAQVLKDNIKNREILTRLFIKWFSAQENMLDNQLVIVASGSSYNAAICAVPFMERCIGSQIRVMTPFAFVHNEITGSEKKYMFVSQSGCSTNVLQAIEKYQKSEKALAVVGNQHSPIGKKADIVIEYGVGQETVGYVTKGMTALSLFFMLAALEYGKRKKDRKTYSAYVNSLNQMADNHEFMYEQSKQFVRKHEKNFLSMEHIYVLGYGVNIGAALEGALKVGEMIHVQTSVYEAEEFVHGPNLQLSPRYTLFFLDSGDAAGQRVKAIYQATKEVTDHAFLISAGEPEGDEHCIGLPKERKTDEFVSPIYLTAFFQYLAYWVSKELHINGEHPLFVRFEQRIQGKTEDYGETSPF